MFPKNIKIYTIFLGISFLTLLVFALNSENIQINKNGWTLISSISDVGVNGCEGSFAYGAIDNFLEIKRIPQDVIGSGMWLIWNPKANSCQLDIIRSQTKTGGQITIPAYGGWSTINTDKTLTSGSFSCGCQGSFGYTTKDGFLEIIGIPKNSLEEGQYLIWNPSSGECKINLDGGVAPPQTCIATECNAACQNSGYTGAAWESCIDINDITKGKDVVFDRCVDPETKIIFEQDGAPCSSLGFCCCVP